VGNRIQENISLAPLTTFGIGGPARYFTEAGSESQVRDAVGFAREGSVRFLILGGGSNMLVSDDGFPGLVIRIAVGHRRFDRVDGGVRVTAGAGVLWDSLVDECVEMGLQGVECLTGIPGRVGATPVQNIGAYGQEVSHTISGVRVLDIGEDAVRDLAPEDCEFSYRQSVFNTRERGRYAILAVEYMLHPGRPPCLSYPDVARAFLGRAGAPEVAEVRDEVRRIRRGKAMLLVPGDPDARSAGSFFRNPVLPVPEFREFDERVRHERPEAVVPSYSFEGQVKVPAAWLVEAAGFPKGMSDGAVGISSGHALAIVNRGGATSGDILRLAGSIQSRVEERFGIRLIPEPVFVGFSDSVALQFGAVVP